MSEILKDSPDLFHQFITYLPPDYYIDENLKKNIQFHTQFYSGDEDVLSTSIEGADLEKINKLFNLSKQSNCIALDNDKLENKNDIEIEEEDDNDKNNNNNNNDYSEMNLAYNDYIYDNKFGKKRSFSEFIQHHNELINNDNNKDNSNNNITQKRPKISHRDISFFEHCKGELSTISFHELLTCFEDYSEGIISLYDLDFLVTNILSVNEILLAEYIKIFGKKFQLNKLGIEPYEYQPSVLIEGLEIISKTPSYIQLPSNFPYQYSSYCDEKANVINYKYISVPTTSAYRSSYKNKYEQVLALYEDYKYEIDIIIECLRSTIKKLEEMKDIEDEKMILESLSDIHYKTISRAYKDDGNHVLQLFKIYPIQCIPVFLKELNESLKQWLSDRDAFNISFRKQYKTNYLRAYDHYSNKFLVQDKKIFIKKFDLTEINELNEKDEMCELVSKNSYSLFFPVDNIFRNDIFNLVVLSLHKTQNKAKMNEYISFYNNLINYLFNENMINHKIIVGNVINTNLGKGVIEYYNPLTHIVEIDYNYCYTFTHIGDVLHYIDLDNNNVNNNNSISYKYCMEDDIYQIVYLLYTIINRILKYIPSLSPSSDIYKDFIKLLQNLVVDSNVTNYDLFIQYCLANFGNYSYDLFDIQKIIAFIEKQIITLYNYDKSHPTVLCDLFSHDYNLRERESLCKCIRHYVNSNKSTLIYVSMSRDINKIELKCRRVFVKSKNS